MGSDDRGLGWLIVFILVVACLCMGVIGVYYLGKVQETDDRYDSFTQNCIDAGGHMYRPDNIGFCLTNDSRIQEVYP